MNDVTVIDKTTGELTQFKPDAAGIRDAALQAAVNTAKRMKDWESLWRAIDELIDHQAQIIAWWDGNVVRPGQSNNAVRRYFSREDAEHKLRLTQQTISKWRKWHKRVDEYRPVLFGHEYKKAFAEANGYRAEGTGQNEWYTPEKYVEAARRVMGSIDLDPASCAEAQEIIKAGSFFTESDNGLIREWRGNVWINPPFSRDLIGQFTAKLVGEFNVGRTTQAVLLTHNNTDTEWFHALARASSAICFTRGRIPFYRGDWVAAPPNGQVFFYLGDNTQYFASVFGAIGLVVTPC